MPAGPGQQAAVIDYIEAHGIDYQRFDHPPVYTVADVHRLTPNLPGAKTKNLFLYAKKGGQCFLVVVGDEKRVDMKGLQNLLGAGRLRFASPDRLKAHLGVDPGSVSLLAVANDTEGTVTLIVDEALWTAEAFQFHPLVNTITLVISREGIARFAAATGHPVRVENIPGQAS